MNEQEALRIRKQLKRVIDILDGGMGKDDKDELQEVIRVSHHKLRMLSILVQAGVSIPIGDLADPRDIPEE